MIQKEFIMVVVLCHKSVKEVREMEAGNILSEEIQFVS